MVHFFIREVLLEDITVKTPSANDYALRKLYAVKDAVIRNQWSEGINHVGDCLARIRNEMEWCYRTDIVLPFMNEFFVELADALATVMKSSKRDQQEQKKLLIEIIDSTVEEVRQATSSLATWNEPDKHLDLLEIEHRRQTYRGKE